MTEAEEQRLHALSAELAGVEKNPWEPRAICAVFVSRPGALVLTMQGWIDLEAVRSPLLIGQEIDADDADGQLTAAVNAFGLGPLLATPEERDELVAAMLDAVVAAFSARLRMQRPDELPGSGSHGFGEWLPILACLVSQIGLGRLDALATPVAQAFMLIAAHRHNQGWAVSGANYARREVVKPAPQTESPNPEEAA